MEIPFDDVGGADVVGVGGIECHGAIGTIAVVDGEQGQGVGLLIVPQVYHINATMSTSLMILEGKEKPLDQGWV